MFTEITLYFICLGQWHLIVMQTASHYINCSPFLLSYSNLKSLKKDSISVCILKLENVQVTFRKFQKTTAPEKVNVKIPPPPPQTNKKRTTTKQRGEMYTHGNHNVTVQESMFAALCQRQPMTSFFAQSLT